jgi:phosphatidate cytidylyltransferase
MTWTRIATAGVLIPIVVGLVLLGSTALVSLAVALVMLLALFEYFALGEAVGYRAYRFWTATCALVLVYGQWLIQFNDRSFHVNMMRLTHKFWPFPGSYPEIEHMFFLFIMGLAVLTLFTRRPLVETLAAAGISSSGLLLVAFPLTYAVRLHGFPEVGPQLLLFALLITWVGDSAAYFVGRAFGKHALARHLSPKKTWEGTVASLFGSLMVAAVFVRWLSAPLLHLLAMAAVGNVAGQVGDLLESAYKRSAGVKDSGGLLPGHGGVLDRIDALILAIPFVWYYWILIYSPRT